MPAPQSAYMEFLKELNLPAGILGASTGTAWLSGGSEKMDSSSPVDGKLIGSVIATDRATYEKVVAVAKQAFTEWRSWPAPRRTS